MPERTIPAPQVAEPPALSQTDAATRREDRRNRYGAWIAAAILVVAAILFVVLTRMKPAYDAYGWMVWGRQTLHWNLDTNGAPSWKPLPFLFTLPFALVARAQTFLWMLTAVAGALAGALFGGRIAYRLTGPAPDRPYAPIIAAAFAGLGVLGIAGYSHQILIANSDPLIVALCLAAIDFHLSKRYRLAFAMVLLAALGRPEAWLFALGYAVWTWWRVPGMRAMAAVGIVSIPLLWFGVSALTARSWLRAGDLALNSPNVIHGNKLIGVPRRVLGLYEPPMQIAAGLAIAFAAVIRDRVWLTLAGLAFAWVAVETAFALHGWSAVTRYLFEPEAVFVVLAGAGLGRVLAAGSPTSVTARLGGVAIAAILIGSLIPTAVTRTRGAHSEIVLRRHDAARIKHLEAVIKQLGGPSRIRTCGQPVTIVGWQSTLAWETGLNVGNVGYKPARSIHKGTPIVLFQLHELGWRVIPIHTVRSNPACAGLRVDTPFQ
ncbi:MAG: hypothetical protein ACXVFQ_05125 [Solirubrobacteraceae bacterium]